MTFTGYDRDKDGNFREMEFHELANWFPMVDERGLEELADDIKKNGLLLSIELFEGKIIDGRNRYKACLMAGVKPDFFEPEIDDPVAYVLSCNLHRRHLDVSQRTMIGAKARDYYDEQAKKRLKTSTGGSKPRPVETFPQADKGKSRDQAGAAVGVSGKSIDKGTKVLNQGVPELAKQVESGKLDVTKAAKIAELPKDQQEMLLEDAERNKWSARQLAEEAKRLQPPKAQPPKKKATPRGSYDDWRKLTELVETIKGAMKEMEKLRVDAQHRIPARTLCESLAERFRKLSRKFVE